MKKMILLLIALVAVMGIHAQVVVEVYKNETLQATYYNTSANKYKVKFKKASDGSNEQVDIYKNGAFDESYTNTSDAKYKVIFRELDGGTINNHDYINIGGKKWGTMNVGATTVAESNTTSFGGYYAWGEVDTYYSSIDSNNNTITWKSSTKTHITGSKSSYNTANYCGGTSITFSEWTTAPYNSESKVLAESYDVARTEWGSTWRMPTTGEFKSLYDACGGKITKTISGDKNHLSAGGIYWLEANTTVDEIEYKVAGMLFVSTTTTSSRVFFPAAGQIVVTSLKSGFGDYWSSSLFEDTNKHYSKSYCFEFESSEVKSQNEGNRYIGHTIRPVSE